MLIPRGPLNSFLRNPRSVRRQAVVNKGEYSKAAPGRKRLQSSRSRGSGGRPTRQRVFSFSNQAEAAPPKCPIFKALLTIKKKSSSFDEFGNVFRFDKPKSCPKRLNATCLPLGQRHNFVALCDISLELY